MRLYSELGKRVFDVVAATAALVVLSPIMSVVSLCIWAYDKGPVLYVSQRVGRKGALFSFLKFRSMPSNTASLPSDKASQLKITPIGRIIRRTNLDELPQLINIIRGDMSIVGPRPAITSQVRLTDLRRDAGALECRPGLTGLAQIRAYDGMPEAEKARHDAEYAEHVTFISDISIILKTFGYVLKPPPTY